MRRWMANEDGGEAGRQEPSLPQVAWGSGAGGAPPRAPMTNKVKSGGGDYLVEFLFD